MNRNLVFHAGCPDGFGAAWSARRAWGNDARYIPRSHDDDFDPERFEDELVIFADISLPNPLLRRLGEVAGEVLILDHHLTARDHFTSDPSVENALAAKGHRVHFDLERSGAMLAWNYFHPGESAPDLLRYVQDQDLWNWELPQSEEINAAIGSYPRRFSDWDELAARPIESLAEEGRPIVRANRIEIERAVAFAHPVAIGNVRIEAVKNLKYFRLIIRRNSHPVILNTINAITAFDPSGNNDRVITEHSQDHDKKLHLNHQIS